MRIKACDDKTFHMSNKTIRGGPLLVSLIKFMITKYRPFPIIITCELRIAYKILGKLVTTGQHWARPSASLIQSTRTPTLQLFTWRSACLLYCHLSLSSSGGHPLSVPHQIYLRTPFSLILPHTESIGTFFVSLFQQYDGPCRSWICSLENLYYSSLQVLVIFLTIFF